MSIKSELRERLTMGQVFCHGSADKLLYVQSAGRRLRELAQEMNLYYFMTKGKKGSGFKVFGIAKKCFHIVKDSESEMYRIKALLTRNDSYEHPVVSRPYKTKKEALNAIKRTR